MEPSDQELLCRYSAGGDESAFAELVRRHAGWIHRAAQRRLRDDHLADDAMQAVFILLAEKAAELASGAASSLPGWMFHVMHFACSRIQRSRQRSEHHEQGAGLMRQSAREPVPDVELLALLEDTIALLPVNERDAVVRRFYQRQDYAGIGAALGISAEAARKQIGRSLIKLRSIMLHDNVDVIPDSLLERIEREDRAVGRTAEMAINQLRANALAKGTMDMVEEAQDMGFAVMSAEFYVKDVETNLDFFEKLGFKRRWLDTPDAMGRLPRASLRGGNGRIWLQRAGADEGTQPTPGVRLFFWIEGGSDALANHRNRIAARGVTVGPFFEDISLKSFSVKSPDGYTIGFFAQK